MVNIANLVVKQINDKMWFCDDSNAKETDRYRTSLYGTKSLCCDKASS